MTAARFFGEVCSKSLDKKELVTAVQTLKIIYQRKMDAKTSRTREEVDKAIAEYSNAFRPLRTEKLQIKSFIKLLSSFIIRLPYEGKAFVPSEFEAQMNEHKFIHSKPMHGYSWREINFLSQKAIADLDKVGCCKWCC